MSSAEIVKYAVMLKYVLKLRITNAIKELRSSWLETEESDLSLIPVVLMYFVFEYRRTLKMDFNFKNLKLNLGLASLLVSYC